MEKKYIVSLVMAKSNVFTFKQVLPYPTSWSLFIIIPCLVCYSLLYYIFFKAIFHLSIMMFFMLIYLGTCFFILKALSVCMTIWFEGDFIYVQKGNASPQKYLKNNIYGFYAYNYETESPALKTSKIYFRFCVTNGKDIYLNDVEYKNRYDEIKSRNLKKFLKSAQTELQFSKVSTHSLQNIYWYSNHD